MRGVRPARPETERAASGHLSAGYLPDQPVSAIGTEPLSPGQRPTVCRHVPQLVAQRLRHVRLAHASVSGEAQCTHVDFFGFLFCSWQWTHWKDPNSFIQNWNHLSLQGSPGR